MSTKTRRKGVFCPVCGNPVAMIFDRENPKHLEPKATLACLGDGRQSCGWSLGFWVNEAEVERLVRIVERGQVAA